MQLHPNVQAVQDALDSAGARDRRRRPLPGPHAARRGAHRRRGGRGARRRGRADRQLADLRRGRRAAAGADLRARTGWTPPRWPPASGVAGAARATPEFVREHTGQADRRGRAARSPEAGAHAGRHRAWPRYGEIWAAGGVPRAVFPTTYAELLRVTAGTAGRGGVTPDAPVVLLHVWRVPARRGAAAPWPGWRSTRAGCAAPPGVRFGKLLGHRHRRHGFGPADADLTRYAAVVVWSDPAAAGRFAARAGRRRLGAAGRPAVDAGAAPVSSRGTWSGRSRSAPSRPGRARGRRPAGRCWR